MSDVFVRFGIKLRAVRQQKGISQEKAKKILRDDEVQGHRLTPRQRRFMGARAGGAPPKKGKGK